MVSGTTVTEITELLAQKVAGVGKPANGTPFLLMKTAEQGGNELYVPPGHQEGCGCVICARLPEPEDESDLIQRLVCDEPLDGESEGDDMTAERDYYTSKSLGQLEKQFAQATDPARRAEIAQDLTHIRLRLLHEGKLAKAMLPGESFAPSPSAGAEGDIALGEVSRYQEATETALARAVGPGVLSADPRSQVQGVIDGTISAEQLPVPSVTPELDFRQEEAEAAKMLESRDPSVRERGGEKLTHARLARLHTAAKMSNNGGDVIPVFTAQADASDVNAIPDGGQVGEEYQALDAAEKAYAADPSGMNGERLLRARLTCAHLGPRPARRQAPARFPSSSGSVTSAFAKAAAVKARRKAVKKAARKAAERAVRETLGIAA